MTVILMVEDDFDIFQTTKLGMPEYTVLHAESLTRALSMLKTVKVDALLLDLNLPDSHGTHTMEIMQAEHPEIPSIVYSGYVNGEFTEIEIIRLGAQSVVRKGHLDIESLKWEIHTSIIRHEVRGEWTRFEQLKANLDDSMATLKKEIGVP